MCDTPNLFSVNNRVVRPPITGFDSTVVPTRGKLRPPPEEGTEKERRSLNVAKPEGTAPRRIEARQE